jgi:hypothetical protein
VPDSVSLLDLGRTLLDLCGVAASGFPGESLLPAAEGRPVGGDAPRFALHAMGTMAAVTQGGWHLLLSRPTLEQGHALELYYLPDDPGCSADRLEEEPERAKAMRRLLVRWLHTDRRLGWVGSESDDESLMSDLRALGYATGGAGEATSFRVGEDCACSWCRRFEE